MTLDALQHLLRAAGALAEDRTVLVLGSAAFLAVDPDLGIEGAPLASTYDADILAEPYDELTATMLDEALGENRAYYRRHGYHADVLRDSILATLPHAWRERLAPVPDVNAQALEKHDVAAVKLRVGRSKDTAPVRHLIRTRKLAADTVRTRIEALPLEVKELPRVLATLEAAVKR